MTLQEKQELLATLNENKDLAKIVKPLQKLTRDEAAEALRQMNLPLRKHIYITEHFIELMSIKF